MVVEIRDLTKQFGGLTAISMSDTHAETGEVAGLAALGIGRDLSAQSPLRRYHGF